MSRSNSGCTNRNTKRKSSQQDRRSNIVSESGARPYSLHSSPSVIEIPRSAEELFKTATLLRTKLKTDSDGGGDEERCISLFLEAAEEALKCADTSSSNNMESQEIIRNSASRAPPVDSPTLAQLYSFVSEAYGNVITLLLGGSHSFVSRGKEKHHYRLRRALGVAADELSLYPSSVPSLVRYGWVQTIAISGGLMDAAAIPMEPHGIHPYPQINSRLSLEENALECFRAAIQLIASDRDNAEVCHGVEHTASSSNHDGKREQHVKGTYYDTNDRVDPSCHDYLSNVYLQATIAFAICGSPDEGISALQSYIDGESMQSPLLVTLLAWLHTASFGEQEGKVFLMDVSEKGKELNVEHDLLDGVTEDMEVPLQILDACLVQFPDFLLAHLIQTAVLFKGTSMRLFRREGLIARLVAVMDRIRAIATSVSTEAPCSTSTHPYIKKRHAEHKNCNVYDDYMDVPLYCLFASHVGICAARNIMSECNGAIDSGPPSSSVVSSLRITKDALGLAGSISDFAINHNHIIGTTSGILSRLCSVKAEVLMLKHKVRAIEVKWEGSINKSYLHHSRELCKEALVHDLRNEHALQILGTLLLLSAGVSALTPSAEVKLDVVQKAHQFFAQAQEIAPRSPTVLQKLAECRSLLGDKDEAAQLLLTACSMRNAEPIFPLTWMMWFV